jgi:hypothetical protein
MFRAFRKIFREKKTQLRGRLMRSMGLGRKL